MAVFHATFTERRDSADFPPWFSDSLKNNHLRNGLTYYSIQTSHRYKQQLLQDLVK